MALKYKINVLECLKNAGFNTNKIRKEKIFAEGTLQKFRQGQAVSADNLNTLCRCLQCQPGDILEYVPDED